MSSLDVDRAAGRTPQYPSRNNGTVSPPLSTSVNPVHITDALKKSPDNGATLDLTHRGLTDVGESGAEELATIGREDIVEDESSVLRYNISRCVPQLPPTLTLSEQNCSGIQSTSDPSHGVCAFVAS
jgi:hypothetical protein